jgi:hypothetical protein
MLAVAAAGLTTHSALTAYRVHVDPRSQFLFHLWEFPGAGTKSYDIVTQHAAPFWPRYRRKLLNQSWPGTYACGEGCTTNMGPSGQVAVTVPMMDPSLDVGGRVTDGRLTSADPYVDAAARYKELVGRRVPRKN